MPIRGWWRAAHALLFLTALMMQAGVASAQAVDGWTEAQQAKRARQYEALSPADVARQVVVKDDSLEAVAVLTTEKVFRFKGGFTDRVRSDAFLRANINKRTGKTTVQLYQELTYTGERRDFIWRTLKLTTTSRPSRWSGSVVTSNASTASACIARPSPSRSPRRY